MRYIEAKKCEVIPIGRQGENEVETVQFDVSGWAEEYGDGTFTLLHQRSRDTAPYECPIEMDGETVNWAVRNTDTAYGGLGEAQLIYTVNEAVAKSVIFETKTYNSLDGNVVLPDPYDDWLREIHEDAEFTRENMDKVAQAEEYAEIAEEKAREASAFVGSPLVASLENEMADHDKVYVYVGNEVGMNNGDWYYWDGTAWVDGGVYNSVAVDTDTTLSVARKPADAKATGDKVTELSTDLANALDLVEYVGEDFDYSGNPGASDSSCLGAKRVGKTIILNGGNISSQSASTQQVYLKLTGTKGRTVSTATVRSWSDGIQLESGKNYLIKCRYISGSTTIADPDSDTLPKVNVYKLGESAKLGYDYRINDTHYRYFVAPEDKINICLYVYCKDITYTNYSVFITLEEVNTQKVPDGYDNVNLYPMLWFVGGIGSNGDNYARNTSIRTNAYLDLDNVYSISFADGISGYIAFYNVNNDFIDRISANGTLYVEALKDSRPTAKRYRIEILSVDGNTDAYNNCIIYSKKSIYGFLDKQIEQKEMADVLSKHRTTSEQFGRTNLTALIVTDIHAEGQKFGILLALMAKWGLSYFDALISCGDTAQTLQSNYPDWFDKNISYIDVPFINVVGNHDAYSSLGVIGSQATTYGLVVEPLTDQDGIVQPTDAATNSLCYYYYDINGIRIIALDCMYWDADEATWLETVLSDAITTSKPVICVSHYGFKESYAEHIPSLWKTNPAYPSDMINIVAAEKVKTFMDNGGTFVCWLVGHSHQDNLYKLKPEYGGQLVVTFASLVQRASNVLKNDDIDAYNYSCATYMAVDLYQHNVKFMRIGADIDTLGVRHRGLALDYQTGELIAAWS